MVGQLGNQIDFTNQALNFFYSTQVLKKLKIDTFGKMELSRNQVMSSRKYIFVDLTFTFFFEKNVIIVEQLQCVVIFCF